MRSGQDKAEKNYVNLTQSDPLPDLKKSNFDKPLAIAPPATLREAKLSPWWPFYKVAIQTEYDGHIESGTWEKVLLKNVPPHSWGGNSQGLVEVGFFKSGRGSLWVKLT